MKDKGQLNCIKEFINSVKKEEKSPIDFNHILEVHRWLFEVLNNLN